MKVSKERIDYFLDKKDNEYNPNLDCYNLQAKGYNQAIRDVKKEIQKISEFEEMTLSPEKVESLEKILMGFKKELFSSAEGVRRIKQHFQLKNKK